MLSAQQRRGRLNIAVFSARNKNRFFCQSPDNNQVNQHDLKSIWGTETLQQNQLKTGSRERRSIAQMLTLATIYNNSEPSFVSRVDFN